MDELVQALIRSAQLSEVRTFQNFVSIPVRYLLLSLYSARLLDTHSWVHNQKHEGNKAWGPSSGTGGWEHNALLVDPRDQLCAHFLTFLKRSQQNGPPAACSRSQLHHVFLHRFSLLSCFTPVSWPTVLKDHVPKETGYTSVCFKLSGDRLKYAYITLLGILFLYPLLR